VEVLEERLKTKKKKQKLTNQSYPGYLPVNRFISEINSNNNKISNVAIVNLAEYVINNNPVIANVIYCNALIVL